MVIKHMTLYDLGIQLIGFIGTGLFLLSFQFKENRNLFRTQLFSYVFYSLHFLLLGAATGGISYIVNGLRSFFLQSKWNFTKSRGMCAALCVLQIAVMGMTWGGWISMLPIIANIASTIGGYTKNPQKVRIAGIFINAPLWIIYNVIVGSWAGVLDEIVTEVSMVVSIIRYGWKNLDTVES